MFNKDTPTVGSGIKALSHIVLRWKPRGTDEYEGHELFDAVQTSEAQARNAAISRAARFQISGTPIRLTYYYSDGSQEVVERVSI
jgi:hypothetical protein